MYNSKHQMWKYLVLNIFHSHWRPLLCFYPYLFPYPSQTMWLKMLMLKLKLFSNKLYWIKQWKLPAQKAVKVMIFDCIINLRFVSSFVFVSRKRLQDVFKTFWSRRIYSPWSYVFGRRLQDILIKTNIFVLVIRLQDILKTILGRLQDVLETSSKRLQDIFKTSCKDVFKTSSRRFQDVSPN